MKGRRILTVLLSLMMVCSLFPQALAINQISGNIINPVIGTGSSGGGGSADPGHSWSPFHTVKEPTCSEYGIQVSDCSHCGQRMEQYIDKLPHTFGEWEITREATDHSAGERQRTCQVCGAVEKERFDPEGTVRPGTHGNETREIQQLLVDQGYLDKRDADGDYGRKTEKAVKQFQKDNGLEPDGIAWPETLECLRHDFGPWIMIRRGTYQEAGIEEHTCSKCGLTETRPIGETLHPNDWRNDEELVLQLQEKLDEMGYPIRNPDGKYGPKTENAVKDFQRDHGFEEDGIVWPGIWTLLFPEDKEEGKLERDPRTGEERPDPSDPSEESNWNFDNMINPTPNRKPNVPDDDDPYKRIVRDFHERDDDDDDFDDYDDDDDDDDEDEEIDYPVLPEHLVTKELDATLEYIIKEKPENGEYYKEGQKVEYYLRLRNNSKYTIRDAKCVPLTTYEWEKLNKKEKKGGLYLETPETCYGLVLECDELSPYESCTWGPFSFHYYAEKVDGGNGTYYLHAAAFCNFYEDDDFLGSAKPTAEAIIKFGAKKAYDLAGVLEIHVASKPANGIFYTDGETVRFGTWFTNTSKYIVKNIKGYRVSEFNMESVNDGTGWGYHFSEKGPLQPGEFQGWGPTEAKVKVLDDGSVRLNYAKDSSHYQGYEYGSLMDGEIVLSAFADADFYKGGEKLGKNTFTAEEAVPIGIEQPGAKLKISITSHPKNGEYYTEGETVTADFELFNTGNVTLDIGKAYLDPGPWIGESTLLVPGESQKICEGLELTVSKGDVENGIKTIKAYANCTFIMAAGKKTMKVTDSATVKTGYKPEASLTVEETSAPLNSYFYEEGEEIQYKVVIHNTGKVKLESAEIRGGTGGESELIGTQTNLPAGADSMPFYVTHKVTYEEAQDGSVTYTATSDARFEHNMELALSGDCTSKTGAPAIMVNIVVANTAPSGFFKRDEAIDYAITVSNIGNVAIPKVDLYFQVSDVDKKIVTLQNFGGSHTYFESYYVSGADVAAGSVTAKATAQGTIQTEASLEASDSVTVSTGVLPVNVSIEVTELSSPKAYGYYTPNEVIDYMVTVTNNGDEALPQAVITSYLPGQTTWLDTLISFAPKDTKAYPVSYTVADADASAGQVAHMGEAVLTLPDDSPMTVDHTLVVKAGFPPADDMGENSKKNETADYCVRTETGEENGVPTYTIDPCAVHADITDTAAAWTDALNMEYDALAAAADEASKDIVAKEREAFFTWLNGQELEDETAAELLRGHCADVCYLVHTAPAYEIGDLLLETAHYISGYEAITE